VKFHGAFAICYAPTASELLIVRVLRTARDVAAIVDRGGFAGG
jgi:hypothetical protein